MVQIFSSLPIHTTHHLRPCPCLVVIALALAALLIPFFLAFASPGFYQPTAIFSFPVNLTFDREFIITVSGSSTNNLFTNIDKGSITESTTLSLAYLEYENVVNPSNGFIEQVTFTLGIAKQQSLNHLNVALLFTCQIPQLGLSTPAVLQFQVSGNDLVNAAQIKPVNLRQQAPLSQTGSNPTNESYSPFLSNATGTGLSAIMQNYVKRQFYWQLQQGSQTLLEQAGEGEEGLVAEFKLTVSGKQGVKAVVQQTVLQQVINGWQQYIALLIPSWLAWNWLVNFMLKEGVIESGQRRDQD